MITFSRSHCDGKIYSSSYRLIYSISGNTIRRALLGAHSTLMFHSPIQCEKCSDASYGNIAELGALWNSAAISSVGESGSREMYDSLHS